ncbi:MAG TPA: CoA transferase [Dehalococcoidia bacterium]|nr:CoA transferase [Dehalococcoidia bacterium]
MSLPLEGVRIIDWTSGQFGPTATSMLGDLGADVIKLEGPNRIDPGRDFQTTMGRAQSGLPEGPNYFFESNNRSKRGITVDLTKEEGRKIVYRLVETADVFVNGFRKPAALKLGLDYKTLSQYNQRLIYAWGNAFGPEGPDSDKPGVDYVVQARSGFMALVGEPESPPLVSEGGLADTTGGVFLGYAIVIALFTRERLGIGQQVDVSILGSMMAAQGGNVSAFTILGSEIAKHKRATAGNPLWNHYKCADGKWLVFAMLWSDRCWPDFCRITGIEHLQKTPKFSSMEARRANSEELVSILDSIFITRPRDEWMKILDNESSRGADIIYSVVNTFSDLPDDPQVIANDYITTFKHPVLGDIKMLGLPYRFHKTPGIVGGSQHRAAPQFGEHNEEILLELGYTRDEIMKFKQEAVI